MDDHGTSRTVPHHAPQHQPRIVVTTTALAAAAAENRQAPLHQYAAAMAAAAAAKVVDSRLQKRSLRHMGPQDVAHKPPHYPPQRKNRIAVAAPTPASAVSLQAPLDQTAAVAPPSVVADAEAAASRHPSPPHQRRAEGPPATAAAHNCPRPPRQTVAEPGDNRPRQRLAARHRHTQHTPPAPPMGPRLRKLPSQAGP